MIYPNAISSLSHGSDFYILFTNPHPRLVTSALLRRRTEVERIHCFLLNIHMYQVNTLYTFKLHDVIRQSHVIKNKFQKIFCKQPKSLLSNEIPLKNIHSICKRYNYNNINTHMYQFPIAL